MLLKVHPQLAASALKHKHANAYGLWCYARSLNESGSGKIGYTELQSACESLGWTYSKFRRSLNQADDLGLLRETTQGHIQLFSLQNSAIVFELTHITAPVLIEAESLKSIKQWKRSLIIAFHAGRNQARPISNGTLKKVLGVSHVTHGEIKHDPAVTVIKNYEQTNIPATPDEAKSVSKFERGAFAARGCLAFQLPNQYVIDGAIYRRAGRGNTRRVNRNLRSLLSLADGHPRKPIGLYHADLASASRALKRAAKQHLPELDRLYVLNDQTIASNGKVLINIWSNLCRN